AGRDQVETTRSKAAARRREILGTIHHAGAGHTGGDLSVIDILTVLYDRFLTIDPANPLDPERDRFILSKGHCSVALYTTLAAAGFIPTDELADYMQPVSRLNGHPARKAVPGVEASTGPLGHGLPFAVGTALAAQSDHSPRRTVVVTGDGELQEGSNWEAMMLASHHGLENLTLIIDRNGIQQGARIADTVGLEPLADKLRSFGWAVADVDGHDHAALAEALDLLPLQPGKPTALIAHTVKGCGVSFIEDRVEWHHRVPTDDEYDRAMAELEAQP
ncbi:MAG: transketolase, partial [Acidimicrobiia bacterium]